MFVACEKVNYLGLKTVHLSANMVKGIVIYCGSATTTLNFFDSLNDSFISVQDTSTFNLSHNVNTFCLNNMICCKNLDSFVNLRNVI